MGTAWRRAAALATMRCASGTFAHLHGQLLCALASLVLNATPQMSLSTASSVLTNGSSQLEPQIVSFYSKLIRAI